MRGYISSRQFRGERVPQSVQNLVIRDYCARAGIDYLLSATEYAMNDSYNILKELLEKMDQVDGIVLYSMLQLPMDLRFVKHMVSQAINAKKEIHFAVEGLAIASNHDFIKIEQILQIKKVLPSCYLGGVV